MIYNVVALSQMGGRSIAISVFVCLSVCPFAYLKSHISEFLQIILYMLTGRGSLLLLRQYNVMYLRFRG